MACSWWCWRKLLWARWWAAYKKYIVRLYFSPCMKSQEWQNINFLPKILIHNGEKRLRDLIKWSPIQENALTFYQILSTVRIRRLILGCYKCFVRVFFFFSFCKLVWCSLRSTEPGSQVYGYYRMLFRFDQHKKSTSWWEFVIFTERLEALKQSCSLCNQHGWRS